MKRIRLIVTGDLERAAMMESLRRFFPEKTYERDELRWLPSRMVAGATTHRLIPDAVPSGPMRTLARAALAELLDGADGRPADLVLVLDDLELYNVDQPEVVCDHFRRAMRMEMQRRVDSGKHQDKIEEIVRASCSFHLLSPMVESYVYGEKEALARAGCAKDVEALLRSDDYEDFWSIDPGWQEHCDAENARKHNGAEEQRRWREERHAKHYLEHLVYQADGWYQETVGGAAAFKTLDWPQVPKASEHLPFIRALFEDLAEFIGCTSPLPQGTASPLTCPSVSTRRDQLLLRNM